MATWRYHRAGLIDWAALVPALVFTGLGAALGAWLVRSVIQITTLKLIVPFLMIGAIVYFLVSPRMTDAEFASAAVVGRLCADDEQHWFFRWVFRSRNRQFPGGQPGGAGRTGLVAGHGPHQGA